MRADREIEQIESNHQSRLTKRNSVTSGSDSISSVASSASISLIYTNNSLKNPVKYSKIRKQTAAQLRDSSYDESFLLSTMNFESNQRTKSRTTQDKLSKISASVLDQSRQSGIQIVLIVLHQWHNVLYDCEPMFLLLWLFKHKVKEASGPILRKHILFIS